MFVVAAGYVVFKQRRYSTVAVRGSRTAYLYRCVWNGISAKLHYTDTGYGHVVQHQHAADEITTILQLVVQQIHHQRTKICHIPTS